MNNTIEKSLENAISYPEYRNLVSDLLAENKSTSEQDSEDLVNYSKLNNSRMKRLDKTTKLDESIISKFEKVDKKQTWLVISEGWCGDAAQNLPLINKLAETSKNIDLKIVLRDENPELMNHFLTNGGQAIPKLIQLDNETNKVINTWGPRPSFATKMVADYKKEHGKVDSEFKKDLQLWYNKNKGESLIEDFESFI
jgi:hypothetical protein